MTTLTDRSIASIRSSLVEFGYSSLTTEEVREASNRMLAGEKPGDIIDMFVQRMLREAGVLKDPDA
jgi:hypothetical protein